jgi:hypothetical protein
MDIFSTPMVNMLLCRGANKIAANNEGKIVLDLIDAEKWLWDESGMLQAKPPPLPSPATVRGTGGRGRGMHTNIRGRGGWRGSAWVNDDGTICNFGQT